ncbi:MAG: rhomboid family intramembrane serine protease [Crocinitomicaceae bacterium]|nr:rhomboid family intramembrane serine protease [Crocinitomicaceae bacterium]
MTVTIVILIITILVSIQAMENQDMKYKMMFNPVYCADDGQWYRVLSHALIHADWMHLIFNMYVLWMFGQGVEMGNGRYDTNSYVGLNGNVGYMYFAVMYVGGAAFATLPSLIRRRHDRGYFSLGASGAVSAVVFSFILLNPGAKMGLLFLPIMAPAYIFGAIYLAAEYFLSKQNRTGIAHDAHFAGAIFGIIFTFATNAENVIRLWKNIF